MLSFEQIKELVELVSRHGLARLEVERSGFKLAIAGSFDEASATRAAAAPAAASGTSPEGAASGAATRSAPPVGAAIEGPSASEGAKSAADHHLLKSPIVGTFYASPSPDAEPFVRVGDRVRKGQVLCIVEAMKLMNEIESDTDGEVVQVLPKNAQPVEYGEPLFAIKVA